MDRYRLIGAAGAILFVVAAIVIVIFAEWSGRPEQVAARIKERAQRAATYEAACERIKCREP